MIRKNWKRLASGLLAAALVVASGCSAVGGVDIKQAVVNSFSVKSSESSLNATLEVIPSASASAEEKAALELVKNITISIPSIKMQDDQNVSLEGEIKVSRGTIPFRLYSDGAKLIATIEGSGKPIVFDLNGILLKNLNLGSNSIIDTITGPVLKESGNVLPILAGLLADHASNPSVISVDSVTEKVHDESLSLKKLHTELKGSEIGAFVSSVLTKIAADDESFKVFLSSLYDVVQPTLKASLQKSGGNSLLLGFLDNKNLTVNFIHSFLKNSLDEAAGKLNKSVQEHAGEGLYSESAYLKTDLYLDSNLVTRKTGFEALIPASKDAQNGVGSLKLTATKEIWNINKPVTATPISIAGDELVVGKSGDAKVLNPSKLLKAFDKQSTAYKVLKDDLLLTRKRINMLMDENAGQDPGNSGKPFIKEGSTLVPVRYVVENLDADVSWNGNTRQVTVKDELSGTVILLTIDSDIAVINGKEIQLESKAIITGGSTYVPVRFIAENLGGKVGWDNNTRTVSIARD